MALALHIAGPTTIQVDVGAGYTTLGYSDNDNLPSVQFTDHIHEVKTVASGMMPEEVVVLGTTATISVALIKWDKVVLDGLLTLQRGASYGLVGTTIIASGQTFGVKIYTPTQSYTFPTCYLQSNSVGDSQWGNRERVLTLGFNATRISGGVLFTQVDV